MAASNLDRATIFRAFDAKKVGVNDGFAFRTDAELEQAYHLWRKAGEPAGACIQMANQAGRAVATVHVGGKEVARG